MRVCVVSPQPSAFYSCLSLSQIDIVAQAQIIYQFPSSLCAIPDGLMQIILEPVFQGSSSYLAFTQRAALGRVVKSQSFFPPYFRFPFHGLPPPVYSWYRYKEKQPRFHTFWSGHSSNRFSSVVHPSLSLHSVCVLCVYSRILSPISSPAYFSSLPVFPIPPSPGFVARSVKALAHWDWSCQAR